MAAATEAATPSLLVCTREHDELSLEELAEKGEDVETDSKFEKQHEWEIEQADQEDKCRFCDDEEERI